MYNVTRFTKNKDGSKNVILTNTTDTLPVGMPINHPIRAGRKGAQDVYVIVKMVA